MPPLVVSLFDSMASSALALGVLMDEIMEQMESEDGDDIKKHNDA